MISRILFVALFCFFATSLFAQGFSYQRHYFIPFENMTDRQQMRVQRSYLGIQYSGMTFASDNHFVSDGKGSSPKGDTTFSLKKRSGFGIGFILGGFTPLKEYGDGGSILALDVAFDFEYSYGSYGWIDALGLNQASKTNIVYWGIPITLMYKKGAEAELNESRKYIYSAGVGVTPSYAVTTYMGVSNNLWKFRPMLMAECGIFAGRALKLRATYYPLSQVFYNGTSKIDDGTLTAKMTGSSNFVISFIFLPYSNHWAG